MEIKLRSSYLMPIIVGISAGLYFLMLYIRKDTLYWIMAITYSIWFLTTIIVYLGNKLTISEGVLYYQQTFFRKFKISLSEIKTMTIRRRKRHEYLEVSTEENKYSIYPLFTAHLIDIQSLIIGKPFDPEHAHKCIVDSEKKRRIGDFIVLSVVLLTLFGLFTYRLAAMNHAKVETLYPSSYTPEFPSELDLETNYSVFVSESVIQSEEDAANAALNAISPELSFFSKLMNNTYDVYYDEIHHFYLIYWDGLPNRLSYKIYIRKGDNIIYYHSFMY
ncbi:MAG: hypothetical protein CVV56_08410 [Tenericutes bacterium HGW-Tenericutes-1]|jgi:hypothetical protein|nr:MAG: hypothetical protein CVV58_00095 [Tenericutes bacterium HGW-Tenericutes-3]PKK99964.1 MAG: hypothetical protein CVV56_08410 [Tenericutes bacterium HGW-Tenericutes-1]